MQLCALTHPKSIRNQAVASFENLYELIRRFRPLWQSEHLQGGLSEGVDDEATASCNTGDRPRVPKSIEKREGTNPLNLGQADQAEPRICGMASANLGKEGLVHHRWTASGSGGRRLTETAGAPSPSPLRPAGGGGGEKDLVPVRLYVRQTAGRGVAHDRGLPHRGGRTEGQLHSEAVTVVHQPGHHRPPPGRGEEEAETEGAQPDQAGNPAEAPDSYPYLQPVEREQGGVSGDRHGG